MNKGSLEAMSSKPEGENSESTEKLDKRQTEGSNKRVLLTASEIRTLSREEIISRYTEVEKFLNRVDDKPEGLSASDLDEKLKLQQQESTRRENVLVMRLATKEQEMQELLAQIHELKQSQTPTTSQLKSTLLDPSVNLLFEKMKTELGEAKEKLEQAQNDLSAWKFTPDSVTGKKLMAKCRMLIAENQDLGKQLSQGRIAQLEAELALQKKYNEELKCSQDELNDFVLQLDEEVEGMESTICALQQELKDTKQKYQSSVGEIEQLTKMLDRSKNCHRHLKRTSEFACTEGTEDDKRSKSMLCFAFGEDVKDALRTQSNTEEEAAVQDRIPIKTSSNNPFSISKILSHDENSVGDNGEKGSGMMRTRMLDLEEGTNGETYNA